MAFLAQLGVAAYSHICLLLWVVKRQFPRGFASRIVAYLTLDRLPHLRVLVHGFPRTLLVYRLNEIGDLEFCCLERRVTGDTFVR